MSAVWPMYRALVGVGMLCGLLIALVYDGTRPVIERNRAEALEQAVFEVLPGASRRVTFALSASGTLVPAGTAEGERVHAGYDATGRLAGVAIEASGMGYADTIALLYGYDPAREAIVGFAVLASKETPGLGDRIETDEAYLGNFEALDVRLDESGTRLARPIEFVKPGAKSEPWQIDGITGATISARAVAHVIAASAQRWLPVIRREAPALVAGDDDAAD